MSGSDPFGGLGGGGDVPPLFRDLARMLAGQGGFQWDQARSFALQLATGGESEPNVDPLERMQLEQLARVAELHVGQAVGLSTSVTGRPLTVVPVTRAQWVHQAADAYRPLFEALAGSLSAAPQPDPGDDATDPMGAFLAQIMAAAQPMMLSLMAGSLLGHLSRRCFGQYDLPVPRPPSDELVLVSANLAEFASAWSLPVDDLRLWVCVHEVASHAVLGVPHVRSALSQLLTDYAAGFQPGAEGFEDRLAGLSIDDPTSPDALQSLQQSFADPEVLLGAIRSDAQRALLPRLEALVSVVAGVVDWTMDRVGENLIGSYGQLTEALRRHRVEADASDRFVEQLLGLELSRAAYERGERFVEGVVERAGTEGVELLWRDEASLPTPAEVDAPGLWLARLEYDTPDDLGDPGGPGE